VTGVRADSATFPQQARPRIPDLTLDQLRETIGS
jgi:hypothetical protein